MTSRFVFSVLVVAACASPAASVTRTVGAAGGTVGLSDGTSIAIPAGALSSDTVITISQTESRGAPPNAVGSVYSFGPDGLTFAVPAEVTIAFNGASAPSDAWLQVETAPGRSTSFTPLGGTIADSSHVTAQTTHFSSFVVTGTSPTVVLGGLNFPANLQVDATGSYWVDQGSVTQPLASRGLGRVMELSSSPTVISAAENDPTSLAHVAGTIYWADGGHPTTVGGPSMATIMSAPDTGAGMVTTMLATGLSFPVALTVDSSGTIYWLDDDLGTVNRMDNSGANPRVLVGQQTKPRFLTVAGGYVYWTDTGLGTVNRIISDGSTAAQTLATGQSQPAGIAVSGNNVYWCNGGDGTVREANLDGSSATIIASGQTTPYAIAADSGFAYWTNMGDGTVMRYDGTSLLSAIARGQDVPYGIALNSTTVFWTTNGKTINDGAVMSTAR